MSVMQMIGRWFCKNKKQIKTILTKLALFLKKNTFSSFESFVRKLVCIGDGVVS